MANQRKHRDWILATSLRAAIAAMASGIMLVLMLGITQRVQAQTYTVIHDFSGPDGATPIGGLSMDSAGSLYGTTFSGGTGFGTVYRLKHSAGGWTITPLYKFSGGSDGAGPYSGVIFGPNHTLYGTTSAGGQGQGACGIYGNSGCGVVFNLKPTPTAPRSVLQPWLETILYQFTGGSDGAYPSLGLVFDQSGVLYGTTEFGGSLSGCQGGGCGTVYQLTGSGSNWTESALYSFADGSDGGRPQSDLTLDNSGNLYGATQGFFSKGSIFQLVRSGSNWTENTLYTFHGGSDGQHPCGTGVTFDNSGNLYGGACVGGSGNGGTAFQLVPSGGSWAFNLIYSFAGPGGYVGPQSDLIFDSAGNLYGTTYRDGPSSKGSVFKLTPSGGSWMYTSLHDFTGGTDGGLPSGNLIFDSAGNLYGTAIEGGANGKGVVFKITP